MKFNNETKKMLLDLYNTKKVMLEGNILKLIDDDEKDSEFSQYIKTAINTDKEIRRKRLDITKQIQTQNKELLAAGEENKNLMAELTVALEDTKKAKDEAEKLRDAAVEDLDTLQKRTQFELIGLIVKVALFVILGVGLITTGLYVFAMVNNYDTKILESSWSNMFGILLTNSFSIIGTIMGVKYATENNNKKIDK